MRDYFTVQDLWVIRYGAQEIIKGWESWRAQHRILKPIIGQSSKAAVELSADRITKFNNPYEKFTE